MNHKPPENLTSRTLAMWQFQTSLILCSVSFLEVCFLESLALCSTGYSMKKLPFSCWLGGKPVWQVEDSPVIVNNGGGGVFCAFVQTGMYCWHMGSILNNNCNTPSPQSRESVVHVHHALINQFKERWLICTCTMIYMTKSIWLYFMICAHFVLGWRLLYM